LPSRHDFREPSIPLRQRGALFIFVLIAVIDAAHGVIGVVGNLIGDNAREKKTRCADFSIRYRVQGSALARNGETRAGFHALRQLAHRRPLAERDARRCSA
jgi:hypothetical protein